jgi:mannose-6-phosphate isomerase-like protein (cupin superfamily)
VLNLSKGGPVAILSEHCRELVSVFLISHFFVLAICCGASPHSERVDVGEILHAMADSFKHKIDDEFSLVVQLDMKDEEKSWHIVVKKGRNITVSEGSHESARFLFLTTSPTLRLIYEGNITAMTAAGKAQGSDQAPLDLRLAEGLEFTSEVKRQLYTFVQHFFNPSVPERILLGEEYSRLIHGGHAIPLYYDRGFRSAWYLLKKGERLNEPGDTNPFPQAFILTEGRGYAKIGDKTIEVKAGESYYIPPGSDHVIWTESDRPLVLIWLAWGEGA